MGVNRVVWDATMAPVCAELKARLLAEIDTMVWKKDLTAITKGGTISKHAHKGFKSQPLSRNGLGTLHEGAPGQRYNNDYGKRPTQPTTKLPAVPAEDDMHDDKAFHLASDDGMPVNDHDEDDAG